MSRGVSDETPELRSFSTDLLCEAIWKFLMVRFLKKTVHDSNQDAHKESVCVVNSRRKERLEIESDIVGDVSERLHQMLCGTQEDTNPNARSKSADSG